jgi:signal peptidase II
MMPAKKFLRFLTLLSVLLTNVACDQISKNFVRQELFPNQTIHVYKNYFILTRVENSGAFLSLGDTMPQPLRFILLFIFPLALLIYATSILFRRSAFSKITLFGLACIIGGGIGNLYDRMMFGSVTDFLFIDFGLLKTGIFNIADVSVMTGSALLLAEYVYTRLKRKEIKPA